MSVYVKKQLVLNNMAVKSVRFEICFEIELRLDIKEQKCLKTLELGFFF